MPRHCSAGGCKSRDNRETRNAGITFHKLPKGASRRNLWISNSHRADSWDPQTDFVYFCSKHFTPESFELAGCSGIRRLKEDAFPTVFDSSSATKCKRSGTPQRPEECPVSRKNPCSGEQNTQQQQEEEGRTPEAPTVQRSAAGETNENVPASSPESAEVEQLSQEESSSSPPPESRSISPSRYMRRLPPPPGFYLPKEHSYAQLCPLLWRRRYDQAIDCLEKALRQLHAARRRENRLRSSMLRVRDKRLKHTKDREGLTPGEEDRRGKVCETVAKSEDTGLFEDRCGDQMDTNSWSEEEKGYCFYCGRGQLQGGGQTGEDVQHTVYKRSVETVTCEEIQIVRLGSPEKIVETSDSNVLLQTPVVQHVIPAAVSLSDTHEHSVQFVGSQQELLLSDMCDGESEATGQEQHLDLQQQLFWIQDDTEGQFILVPVADEDDLQNFVKMEGVADQEQTILVSEVDVKGDFGLMAENSGGLSRGETACDDENGDQHSVLNRDVREKLKEHLEGFHLQLSTEFIN